MNKLLALSIALPMALAVQSARAMPLTVPQIQTASTQSTRYDCRDGKSITVQYTTTRNRQSFAALTVDGRKLLFVNVIAGSGAKYAADQYVQGPRARKRTCTTRWPPRIRRRCWRTVRRAGSSRMQARALGTSARSLRQAVLQCAAFPQ